MQALARDFRGESEALHALVEPLDEAELDRATAFKGWTINMVIRHLHIWNLAAEMSLKADGSFEAYYAKLAEHLGKGGKMTGFEAEWLDGLKGQALVAAWQAGLCRERRSALRRPILRRA